MVLTWFSQLMIETYLYLSSCFSKTLKKVHAISPMPSLTLGAQDNNLFFLQVHGSTGVISTPRSLIFVHAPFF